jgi:glutathione S-transferase
MVAQLPAIITVLAVVLTIVFAVRVSLLRVKYKIDGPAVTGHPQLERAVRVHANTVEQMVVFLPLLWLGAMLYSETIAFWLGIAWLVGRAAYMVGYMISPPKRAPGLIITLVALTGLLVITIMGLAM